MAGNKNRSEKEELLQDGPQERVAIAKEVTPLVAIETNEVAEAKDPPEQLIYIGPPIGKNGIALRTHQTFIGGHPAYYESLYTAYPLIKKLFVPVTELREAQKQIATAGTALNIAVQSLKGV
ncbi:hypothetical protein [Paenibacillus brevis]|uniref:Uncharacterized protein n=1 Tax=Paenibacillus brevis TaxID=2841508 RepID=A0ABS6FTB0_9BACL|nr:hypothetical protein [Paenibacillus brevis]MBU5672643.1 hypothetical protein [Paenibacillus brevis]